MLKFLDEPFYEITLNDIFSLPLNEKFYLGSLCFLILGIITLGGYIFMTYGNFFSALSPWFRDTRDKLFPYIGIFSFCCIFFSIVFYLGGLIIT